MGCQGMYCIMHKWGVKVCIALCIKWDVKVCIALCINGVSRYVGPIALYINGTSRYVLHYA